MIDCSRNTPDTIRIDVHYPAAPGEIYLRADADWERDVEAANVTDDGRCHSFEITTKEPAVYYKARLRGAWSAGPNRLATAGAEAPFDCFPYFQPSTSRLTELESLEHGGRGWQVRVSLPPGYDENTCHRYPTLYMNDGHNVFLAEESATGTDWDVQGMLERLDRMTSVEQVVVVGVYTDERAHDYGSVGAEGYSSFLAETLVPWIGGHFRTLTEARHRALIGSSLGGVAALDTALRRPDVFAMAGCMSATFGYDDELASRITGEDRRDIRIYLDSGWSHDNFEVTRDMRARLLHSGYVEGRDLMYLAHPGASHSESAWSERLHLPLQFFFAERPNARSRAGGAVVEPAGV